MSRVPDNRTYREEVMPPELGPARRPEERGAGTVILDPVAVTLVAAAVFAAGFWAGIGALVWWLT